jgi:phosphoglycolate phosphatase-like HAD superfamily hydrolase
VTTVLVSFDIDGTMEFGEPPGPVPASVVRELVARGYVIGCASDWPRSSQQPLWSRHGVEPHFVGGKHQLHLVREKFEADRYLHVGDTDIDERYALLAGFEFLHVTDIIAPVIADSIHDDEWAPD